MTASAHLPAGTTRVELLWQERQNERWLRFGHEVGERIVDRRRRHVAFRPGAIFAFVRWAANDYGTALSRIDILQAVAPGEAYATLPFVDPGADILLHLHGWPKVQRVLLTIDAIEAAGIDPTDAAPDYWRHVHARLLVGETPRAYGLARHRAWMLRRAMVTA